MRAISIVRNFPAPAGFAIILSLLMLAPSGQRAFAQGDLTEDIKRGLVQLSALIKENSPTGQRYLRESGLHLVVVLPSMESMLEHLRQAHAAGQIDDQSLRSFEQRVMAAPL